LVGEKGPHRPDFSSVTKVHASLEVIGIMGIAVPTVTDEMSLIPYPESMTTDKLTETIIGAAIEVHRELGPGLLESAYEACLAYELAKRGRRVSRQVPLPIKDKGVELAEGYRIDLLVDDLVVVEVKACDGLNPIHQAQLLSYLRLSGRQVGLLLNFHSNAWSITTAQNPRLPEPLPLSAPSAISAVKPYRLNVNTPKSEEDLRRH
jgi:GxxExxY protein